MKRFQEYGREVYCSGNRLIDEQNRAGSEKQKRRHTGENPLKSDIVLKLVMKPWGFLEEAYITRGGLQSRLLLLW